MKKYRFITAVCGALCVLAFPSHSSAQGISAIGKPGEAAVIPVEHGFIDPATGNLHIEIPLETYKQRGETSDEVRLVYDSSIWQEVGEAWQPTNVPNSFGGWRIVSTRDAPEVYFDGFNGTASCPNSYYQGIHAVIWPDLHGSTHYFPVETVQIPNGCSAPGYTDTPSGEAFAADGSGYYAEVSNYNNVTIYDPRGTAVANSQQKALNLDRNGNYIGTASDANGSVLDTQGRQLYKVSSNGSNLIYYDILTYNGGYARYTLTTRDIAINTQFDVFGSQFSGTIKVVTNLALPDGTSYFFSYDGSYGQMIIMGLPKGGSVNYTYQTGNTGTSSQTGTTNCRPTDPCDRDTPPQYVATHDGVDGQIRITIQPSTVSPYIPGSDTKGTITTVQKADGSSLVYAYNLRSNYIHPSYIGYYSGQPNLSNLLQNRVMADFITYDSTTACPGYLGSDRSVCYGLMWALPIEISRIDDLAQKIKTTKYIYQSNAQSGVPETELLWDFFGQSAGAQYGIPAEPSGQATNEIIAPQSFFVHGRPFSSTLSIYGNGSLASQTTFLYDEPTYTTAVSGAPQLAPVSGARGNVTTVSRLYLEDSHTAETHLFYDDAGVVVRVRDPFGKDTVYTHDSTDTFVQITQFPNPAVTDYTQSEYDPSSGLLTHSWNENRAETSYDYDSIGRLHTITRQDGGTSVITHPSQGETDVTRTVGGSQLVSKVYVDGYGRNVRKTIGSGSSLVTTDIAYDVYGRLNSISNPYGTSPGPTDGSMVYQYDYLDRVTVVTKPDGNSVGIQYLDASDEIITDENGHKKQYGVDAFGRTSYVLEEDANHALNWKTTYTYDNLGLLHTITQMGASTSPSDWRTSSFVNDSFGRLVSMTMPEFLAKTMQYDDNDNLKKVTDAAGRTVSYDYDDRGRPTDKIQSIGASYNYTYDAQDQSGDPYGIGKLTGYTSTQGIGTRIKHDQLGHMSQENFCLPSDCSYTAHIAASYDQADSVTDFTYPDGRVAHYNFDPLLHQLQSVSTLWGNTPESNTPLVSDNTYNAVGFLTNATLQNGVSQNSSFSNRLSLTSLSYVTSQGSTIYSKQLTWDPTGANLSGVIDNVDASKTTSYTYDQVNRLSGAVADGPVGPSPSSALLTLSGQERTRIVKVCIDPDAQSSRSTAATAISSTAASPAWKLPPQPCTTTTVYDSGNLQFSTGMSTESTPYDGSQSLTQLMQNLVSAINADSNSPVIAQWNNDNTATVTIKPSSFGTFKMQLSGVSNAGFTPASYSGTSSSPAISDAPTPSSYALSESYTYGDAWGNITQSGNFSFQESYDAHNRMTSGDYLYDDATGNLLQENVANVVTNSYGYDAQGAMTSSNGNSYVRDPFSRRVSKTGSTNVEYVYLGGRIIGTKDPGTGQWTDRVWANGGYLAKIAGYQGAPPVFRLSDYLGSSSLLIDAAGNQTGAAEFAPYGQIISQTGMDSTLFTGDDYDSENNTHSTQYRNLAPRQGRWLTPDPTLSSINLLDPQTLNRYAYVSNRPTRSTDKAGLDGDDDEDDGDDDCIVCESGPTRAQEGESDDDVADLAARFPFPVDQSQTAEAPPQQSPTGELAITFRYNYGDPLQAETQAGDSNGNSVADGAMVAVASVGALIPGPIGAAFGTGLAVNAAFHGNYGSAALYLGGAALQFFGVPGEEVVEAGVTIAEEAPTAEAVADATGDGLTGTRVYRAWGYDLETDEGSIGWGHSWTREDPSLVENFRNSAALPNVNTGRFVSEGILRDATGVTIRPGGALPLDGNVGGLDEILVPDPAAQIDLVSVKGVNPHF